VAKYTVPDNNLGAYKKKAAAATVDEVTFTDTLRAVEVTSDGTSEIYFTVDGSTPTVGGSNCHEIPATGGTVVRTVTVPSTSPRKVTVVKLISAATPTYSVARVSE